MTEYQWTAGGRRCAYSTRLSRVFEVPASTLTGLLYEPTLEMPAEFGDEGVDIKHFRPTVNTPEFTGLSLGIGDVPADAGHSVLKAWDPLSRRIEALPGQSETSFSA